MVGKNGYRIVTTWDKDLQEKARQAEWGAVLKLSVRPWDEAEKVLGYDKK